MSVPRFYCPDAQFQLGEKTFLSEKARHHAGRVLRMVAGDPATLFDGQGNQATGPIAFEGKDAWITVQSIETPQVESPVHMTLVQALVSPEKMDWIVEKAVETGIKNILIVPANRSVTKLQGERLQKRLLHWKEIAISACAQCGRCFVPEIRFCSLSEALNISAHRKLFLAPAAQDKPNLSACPSIAFAVGPEGGFDSEEISAACQADWQCALIGPRVLRTETAGIVAASLINAVCGDYAFD